MILFQDFADLYSPDDLLRIRLHNGTDFITTISDRIILEYDLHKPKQTTLSIVVPDMTIARPGGRPAISQSRYTGESPQMLHSVWGFYRPDQEHPSIVLDLASMQFGAVGRGRGGDFFILDAKGKWEEFVRKIARDLNFRKESIGINPVDDIQRREWFKEVAQRVKKRWEARDVSHWCGLCGKPDVTKRCGQCSREYYCSDAHCAAAWKRWHKKWCVPKMSK